MPIHHSHQEHELVQSRRSNDESMDPSLSEDGDEEFHLDLSNIRVNDDQPESDLFGYEGEDGTVGMGQQNTRSLWRDRIKRICTIGALLTAFILLIVFALKVSDSYRPYQPSKESPQPTIRTNNNIIKSPSDHRTYRFIQLTANSLPVLLIHDSRAEKSSAAMSVGTGSASDPKGREGLAHFLEHMLFMGSTPFPDENDYSSFLQTHAGRSNAFTSEEETNFYFDILPQFFEPILARFAGFFTAPLLSSSGVSREMHAVESEHRKNLLNDDWRNYAMLHEVADVKSSFHHFGTGTMATLNHTGIIDDLRLFWSQHYRATNLNLVLLGRESLDDLQQLATKYFEAVPGEPIQCDNTGDSNPTATSNSDRKDEAPLPDLGGLIHQPSSFVTVDEPFTTATCNKYQSTKVNPFGNDSSSMNRLFPFPSGSSSVGVNLTFIPASLPSYHLNLYFPLPNGKYPETVRRTDPIGYIAYMLGHEGSRTTLCAHLKRINLVQSISVGLVTDSKDVNQVLLGLEMKLTELGNEFDNRMKIIEAVFEYVGMLKGLPSAPSSTPAAAATQTLSHSTFYSNMLSEMAMRFNFKEAETPITYTSNIASRMTLYQPFGLPVEHILLPPNEAYQFASGSSSIHDMLEKILPQNMILIWSSSTLQDDAVKKGIESWKTEQWYDIEYHTQPLTSSELTHFASFLAISSSPTPASTTSMTLPPESNEFMPSNDVTVIPWSQLMAAAAKEIDTGESNVKTARDALREEWGEYDPTNDVPVSVPLSVGDGSSSTNLLYYKPDLTFALPRGYITTFMRLTPVWMTNYRTTNSSSDYIENQLLLQLYHAYLTDLLTPLLYQLSLVGYSLTFELHSSRSGFIVGLGGPSHGIEKIWKRLMTSVTQRVNGEMEEERFRMVMQVLYQNSFQSFATDLQPYEHGLYYIKLWEEATKVDINTMQATFETAFLNNSTFQTPEFHSRLHQILNTVGLTTFVYGNLNITTAKYLHQLTVDSLKSDKTAVTELSPLLVDQWRENDRHTVYLFNDVPLNRGSDSTHSALSSSYVYSRSVLNPAETNSAIIYDLQMCTTGVSGEELRCSILLSLLNQLMSGETFQQLRTRETLGYIVTSRVRETIGQGDGNSVRSFEFLIQSDRFDPLHLETRIEYFIRSFQLTQIAQLTDQQLAIEVDTLRTTIQQSMNVTSSMTDQFQTIWTGKIGRERDLQTFTREKKQLEILNTITRDEFKQFYMDKLVSLATRRKFVVRIVSSQFDPSTLTPDPTTLNDEEMRQRLGRDILITEGIRNQRNNQSNSIVGQWITAGTFTQSN